MLNKKPRLGIDIGGTFTDIVLEKNKIFKDYYFILTAMNGWHALRPHNRKFYFNTFIFL